MSNFSFLELPDDSPSHSFTLAFRPRVPPPCSTQTAIPLDDPIPMPDGQEMADGESGEVHGDNDECLSHTPESFTRPSSSDDRNRSRSPRYERSGNARYRDRSRSSSPPRGRSSSPRLHPTGVWEADFWPPLCYVSPRTRGVQASDFYRPTPKSFLERVEERARIITLREAGVPEGPKASRMTWAEQVEARAQNIGLQKSNCSVINGKLQDALPIFSDGRNLPQIDDRPVLDRWFPDRCGRVCHNQRRSGFAESRNWQKVDSVNTLNYDDPASQTHLVHIPQEYGRLSRPSSSDDDEELKSESATQPRISDAAQSSTKSAQCKAVIGQMHSWMSDQPPAQGRPLPTVARVYNLHTFHNMGVSKMLMQMPLNMSKDAMTNEAITSTPTYLFPAPSYPEQPLDYD